MNTLAENPLVDDVGLLSKGVISQAEIIPKSCAHKIGTLDGSICIQTGVFFRSHGDVQQKSDKKRSVWVTHGNMPIEERCIRGLVYPSFFKVDSPYFYGIISRLPSDMSHQVG
jgi:hypothetical protein